MRFLGIPVRQHGGDSSLCPGTRTIDQFPFGQNRDLPLLGEVEGCGQRGKAAADYEDVGAMHLA